jgi:hypothetical protein
MANDGTNIVFFFAVHDDTVVILHLRHSAQRDLTEDDLEFSSGDLPQ